MPVSRHLTTRRGFVAALGFGAVSVYGAWAAYDAAPLPFSGHAGHDPAPGGGDHAGHDPAPMTAGEFRTNHAAFVARYRQPDGSVAPGIAPPMAMTMDHGGHHDEHHGDHSGHSGHAGAADGDVYLLARRWGYDPDVLRLRVGVPYRVRMMSDDIPHGASIQMGAGSRIIRLAPEMVSVQTLTFTAPGEYLVYCTLYCGQGHDAMFGRIVVA